MGDYDSGFLRGILGVQTIAHISSPYAKNLTLFSVEARYAEFGMDR